MLAYTLRVRVVVRAVVVQRAVIVLHDAKVIDLRAVPTVVIETLITPRVPRHRRGVAGRVEARVMPEVLPRDVLAGFVVFFFIDPGGRRCDAEKARLGVHLDW